ncbi:phospholipase A [Klebsiella aerogenes]|uniref:phospholipase A n=1 Tax=Klebsiella aerogenes TaxID=548 RepID=UPI0007501367|nr:phospholipase A [Klebsiella aerogenes]EIX9086192.1 phospholipase A [Klebsiella aerogenes]EKU6159278.1 phospholipase A [Klebsiella aerogenes]KUQ11463.1 phospholipase [Klebsiella aerogenes]MBX9067122.1 phospholipase A [Klebsiella aerogenes]MDS1906573.1 phospholipase A [Klebsiella aerogenes]
MRISLAWLLALSALPAGVLAQDAPIEQTVHDKPAVRGSIIANLLQDHDNPFLLYPYESNYLLYTWTSDLNKEAIRSYDWADDARKDEVKFQLSLAFPLWRGILGDNSLLGASYTQKSWWQLSNSKGSAPFRETNYEPQLFLGFATDYEFAGWTLRDIEVGYNHDSNGRSDPTSRSWNRLYTRLMAQNGNWLVEVKPWYVVGSTDDNPDITKYMGYYRLKIGYQLGEAILSAQGQYNWNTGYGGAEIGVSYPITKHVRAYTQIYSGYGESLIDYNFNQTRVGVGVMLNDLF